MNKMNQKDKNDQEAQENGGDSEEDGEYEEEEDEEEAEEKVDDEGSPERGRPRPRPRGDQSRREAVTATTKNSSALADTDRRIGQNGIKPKKEMASGQKRGRGRPSKTDAEEKKKNGAIQNGKKQKTRTGAKNHKQAEEEDREADELDVDEGEIP